MLHKMLINGGLLGKELESIVNASVGLSQSKTQGPGKGFNPSKLTEANII